MRRFFRPTWAEVSLPRLRANIKKFRARLPPRVKLLFVVKANAYGHGALECSRAAQAPGLADWLGVSSVEEGVALREGGLRLPILVLGSLYPFESFLAAAEYRLTPTIASLESARRLAVAARRLGRPVAGHIKIETGMGRIGVGPAGALGVVDFIREHPAIELEGVYTHFSCADTNRRFTNLQIGRFKSALAAISARGVKVGLRHAANSAAALGYPSGRWDMVRPGLALYGLHAGFDPVMAVKSKIVFIKTVRAGTAISYGARWRAKRTSRIATIPAGYADGFSRGLSAGGEALVRGRRCRVAGAITMDMSMLDVSRIPEARVGDDVVLIGSAGGESIRAVDIARRLKTIPYEVTCAVSSRVPRVYLR